MSAKCNISQALLLCGCEKLKVIYAPHNTTWDILYIWRIHPPLMPSPHVWCLLHMYDALSTCMMPSPHAWCPLHMYDAFSTCMMNPPILPGPSPFVVCYYVSDMSVVIKSNYPVPVLSTMLYVSLISPRVLLLWCEMLPFMSIIHTRIMMHLPRRWVKSINKQWT